MKKFISLASIMLLVIVFSTSAMADSNVANSATTSTSGSTAIIEKGAFQDNRQYEGAVNQATKTRRFFASPGEMNYPNAPGMFGQDDNNAANAYMLMTVNDINEYDVDGQTTAAAKKMAKGGSKRVLVRSKFGPVDKELRLDMDTPMNFVYEKQEGMKSLGIIVIVSDSKKSIAADVFARAQVEAHKLGGTTMHIKAQGWQRLVRNSGGGIGFTWTGTTISGGQTTAATGVIGAGYSWGQAGYYKHPFIIMHVLAPM
jgi:hypothetical protein